MVLPLPFGIEFNIIVLWFALACDFAFIFTASYFTASSWQEGEQRAAKFGIGLKSAGIIILILLLFVPSTRLPIALLFITAGTAVIILALPTAKAPPSPIKGEIRRFDERDTVFARQRCLTEGSEQYKEYYTAHPELERPDAERRVKGFMGTPGKIDTGGINHVKVMESASIVPRALGRFGTADGRKNICSDATLGPVYAAEFVKKLTIHLGAQSVGICKLKECYVYSNRGEQKADSPDKWGDEINAENLPPYAVVFLIEMNAEHVRTAPHTPTTAESLICYAKGAYIATILTQWFAGMGYRAVSQTTYRYDVVLPPLAVDAGLGEMGRHGYLIAPKYGARVRIFAVLTDMPLIPDKTIHLGVDAFCERCMKCADTCPSRAIPFGEKTVFNGVLKWKLNAEKCFDYWARVGTDCGICMSVCPFSRPDTVLHRIIRWFIARSSPAQQIFPFLDAFVYGSHRKPESKTGSWLDYRVPHKQEKTDDGRFSGPSS